MTTYLGIGRHTSGKEQRLSDRRHRSRGERSNDSQPCRRTVVVPHQTKYIFREAIYLHLRSSSESDTSGTCTTLVFPRHLKALSLCRCAGIAASVERAEKQAGGRAPAAAAGPMARVPLEAATDQALCHAAIQNRKEKRQKCTKPKPDWEVVAALFHFQAMSPVPGRAMCAFKPRTVGRDNRLTYLQRQTSDFADLLPFSRLRSNLGYQTSSFLSTRNRRWRVIWRITACFLCRKE